MNAVKKPEACTSEIPALGEGQSQAQLLSPSFGVQEASLAASTLFSVSTSLSGLRSSMLSKSPIGGLYTDDLSPVHN